MQTLGKFTTYESNFGTKSQNFVSVCKCCIFCIPYSNLEIINMQNNETLCLLLEKLVQTLELQRKNDKYLLLFVEKCGLDKSLAHHCKNEKKNVYNRQKSIIIKEGLGVTKALSSDKCKIDVPLIVYHQGSKIYHHNNFYGIFTIGNFTIRDDDAMYQNQIHS